MAESNPESNPESNSEANPEPNPGASTAGSVAPVSTLAHKFLLQLLASPEHSLPLNEIHPNPQTPLAQCRTVARQLRSLGLINYDETILEIAITPKGRLMFEMGMAARPVTPDELLVLKSCRYNRITMGQISRKVPEAMRRSLIDALESRKFVKTKRQIDAVELTSTGLAHLGQSEINVDAAKIDA